MICCMLRMRVRRRSQEEDKDESGWWGRSVEGFKEEQFLLNFRIIQ